jgi:hypothetical protein
MSLTQDNIDEFRESLSNAGMPTEKIGQAIALIQMLHTNDPNLWNFENCDRLIAGFVTEITTNELQNIDEILIKMAQAAKAPVASNRILVVEWYRETFLYLLAAGVSFATLQAMFPGVFSFVLDATYALYQQLLSQGVTNQDITTAVASASPLSASSMAQAISVSGVNMAQAIAVSSTNLVTAAFYACADVAKNCALAVSQNYADCLRYGTELLGFAVATRVVPPVVEKAAKAVKTVADVASGSADEKIAQWIDEGGPQKVQDAIAAAGADVVDATKAAIKKSIDDMASINQGLIDSDIKPPSRHGPPSINELIYNWLHTYIENFQGDYQGDYHAAITSLIGDLSEIDFSDTEGLSDEGNPGVQKMMKKYGTTWENAGFRALIAVWKLATEKPEKIEHSSSQLDPRSEYWVHPAVVDLKRAYSLPKSHKYREDNEGTQILHTIKKRTGADRYDVSSLQSTTPEVLTGELSEKYQTDHTIRDAIQESGALTAITQNPNLHQAVLEAINNTQTEGTVGNRGADERNKNAYINNIKMVIGGPLKKSKEESGGSRHRRKSRRYKKRKATLKRRGLKKRRTRKGKKRRHTKKRR